MKIRSMNKNNTLKILMACFISLLMCFCMCACGGSGNTEETIEITTPTEEATASKDNAIKTITSAKDDGEEADGDEESGGEGQDSSAAEATDSPYKTIYKACNVEMKKTTSKYVSELKEKSSSVSKSTLYDETQNRIDGLKKIYDDGKSKMVDAMLASTEDDEEIYKKNFNKLTEKYMGYTREITEVYMNAF